MPFVIRSMCDAEPALAAFAVDGGRFGARLIETRDCLTNRCWFGGRGFPGRLRFHRGTLGAIVLLISWDASEKKSGVLRNRDNSAIIPPTLCR